MGGGAPRRGVSRRGTVADAIIHAAKESSRPLATPAVVLAAATTEVISRVQALRAPAPRLIVWRMRSTSPCSAPPRPRCSKRRTNRTTLRTGPTRLSQRPPLTGRDQSRRATPASNDRTIRAARPGRVAVNQISPLRFIVGFGIVSALADVVYEGARSIIGPYLGSLGATAAVVGLVTGAGEAAALVLRLFTGTLADRLGKPWPQTMLGYGLTAICVPLLAVSGGLIGASLLYDGERVGKAVRTPARDSMLAHASAEMGRGYAFGCTKRSTRSARWPVRSIAATLALGGHYRLAFALLPSPGGLALFALVRVRRRAPTQRCGSRLRGCRRRRISAWRLGYRGSSGSTPGSRPPPCSASPLGPCSPSPHLPAPTLGVARSRSLRTGDGRRLSRRGRLRPHL